MTSPLSFALNQYVSFSSISWRLTFSRYLSDPGTEAPLTPCIQHHIIELLLCKNENNTILILLLLMKILPWPDHICHVKSKIAQNLGLLFHISKVVAANTSHAILCFNTSISYCNIIWPSNYPSQLKSSHILHRSSICITCNLSPSSSYKFKFLKYFFVEHLSIIFIPGLITIGLFVYNCTK